MTCIENCDFVYSTKRILPLADCQRTLLISLGKNDWKFTDYQENGRVDWI